MSNGIATVDMVAMEKRRDANDSWVHRRRKGHLYTLAQWLALSDSDALRKNMDDAFSKRVREFLLVYRNWEDNFKAGRANFGNKPNEDTALFEAVSLALEIFAAEADIATIQALDNANIPDNTTKRAKGAASTRGFTPSAKQSPPSPRVDESQSVPASFKELRRLVAVAFKYPPHSVDGSRLPLHSKNSQSAQNFVARQQQEQLPASQFLPAQFYPSQTSTLATRTNSASIQPSVRSVTSRVSAERGVVSGYTNDELEAAQARMLMTTGKEGEIPAEHRIAPASPPVGSNSSGNASGPSFGSQDLVVPVTKRRKIIAPQYFVPFTETNRTFVAFPELLTYNPVAPASTMAPASVSSGLNQFSNMTRFLDNENEDEDDGFRPLTSGQKK